MNNWDLNFLSFQSHKLAIISRIKLEHLLRFIFDHIRLAYEYGITITAVVFDGLAANIACAEILGAKLDLENLQHWFPHPVTGKTSLCHLGRSVHD